MIVTTDHINNCNDTVIPCNWHHRRWTHIFAEKHGKPDIRLILAEITIALTLPRNSTAVEFRDAMMVILLSAFDYLSTCPKMDNCLFNRCVVYLTK